MTTADTSLKNLPSTKESLESLVAARMARKHKAETNRTKSPKKKKLRKKSKIELVSEDEEEKADDNYVVVEYSDDSGEYSGGDGDDNDGEAGGGNDTYDIDDFVVEDDEEIESGDKELEIENRRDAMATGLMPDGVVVNEELAQQRSLKDLTKAEKQISTFSGRHDKEGLSEMLEVFLSGKGEIDKFLGHFDSMLLNETFISFCATRNRQAVRAAVTYSSWKCVDLDEEEEGICYLCEKPRKENKFELVTQHGVRVGLANGDCGERFMLLKDIHHLRKNLIALIGCPRKKEKAKEYSEKMLALSERCIFTLQKLDSRFAPKN